MPLDKNKTVAFGRTTSRDADNMHVYPKFANSNDGLRFTSDRHAVSNMGGAHGGAPTDRNTKLGESHYINVQRHIPSSLPTSSSSRSSTTAGSQNNASSINNAQARFAGGSSVTPKTNDARNYGQTLAQSAPRNRFDDLNESLSSDSSTDPVHIPHRSPMNEGKHASLNKCDVSYSPNTRRRNVLRELDVASSHAPPAKSRSRSVHATGRKKLDADDEHDHELPTSTVYDKGARRTDSHRKDDVDDSEEIRRELILQRKYLDKLRRHNEKLQESFASVQQQLELERDRRIELERRYHTLEETVKENEAVQEENMKLLFKYVDSIRQLSELGLTKALAAHDAAALVANAFNASNFLPPSGIAAAGGSYKEQQKIMPASFNDVQDEQHVQSTSGSVRDSGNHHRHGAGDAQRMQSEISPASRNPSTAVGAGPGLRYVSPPIAKSVDLAPYDLSDNESVIFMHEARKLHGEMHARLSQPTNKHAQNTTQSRREPNIAGTLQAYRSGEAVHNNNGPVNDVGQAVALGKPYVFHNPTMNTKRS